MSYLPIWLDMEASKGTIRFSEWLYQFLKSRLTPTPAASQCIKLLDIGIWIDIWVHGQFTWAIVLLSTHISKFRVN